ncbi:MAG: PEP-CTERM sorting domain-containing protein [Planctomycetota bacterium]
MKKNRNKSVVDNKRWSKYAAAAAAGAVTVVGAQSTVDADITIMDVNTSLVDRSQGDGYFDTFGPYSFGGAGASFSFQQAFNETASGEGQLLVIGAGSIQIAGQAVGPYFYPSNLAYGQAVSTASFNLNAGDRGDMAWGAGYSGSQFTNAGVGYVGFSFDLGNGTQYGWAEVDVAGAPVNTATFLRYGWGMPGDQVLAGVGQIPEPGSLGVLAMGSVGLLAWRRRKSA